MLQIPKGIALDLDVGRIEKDLNQKKNLGPYILECPKGMSTISWMYIDQYEYPNIPGQLPLDKTSLDKAKELVLKMESICVQMSNGKTLAPEPTKIGGVMGINLTQHRKSRKPT